MSTAHPDEPEGGDPPCWAHLFEDAADPDAHQESVEGPVDLAVLARMMTTPGAAWSYQGEDLNANLLVFASGEGVAEHVNPEVDVLLVGIAGEGIVAIDGTRHALHAGHALVIPRDARWSIRGQSDPFAYLTCHRRRAGLWPTRHP